MIFRPCGGQASEERWRPGSGPAALTCFPGHPLPPCVEAAKPVPLPPSRLRQAGLCSRSSLPPPPAGSLHSHFLSLALEPWRPGPAAPGPRGHVGPAERLGKSWPTLLRTSGLPTFLPGLHPIWSTDPKGRHAPAWGLLSLRPGLGATPAGTLQAPGGISTPAGEGGLWGGMGQVGKRAQAGFYLALLPSRADSASFFSVSASPGRCPHIAWKTKLAGTRTRNTTSPSITSAALAVPQVRRVAPGSLGGRGGSE